MKLPLQKNTKLHLGEENYSSQRSSTSSGSAAPVLYFYTGKAETRALLKPPGSIKRWILGIRWAGMSGPSTAQPSCHGRHVKLHKAGCASQDSRGMGTDSPLIHNLFQYISLFFSREVLFNLPVSHCLTAPTREQSTHRFQGSWWKQGDLMRLRR